MRQVDTPVICIAESGGAASAIYYYMQGGQALVEEHEAAFLSRGKEARAVPWVVCPDCCALMSVPWSG